MPKSRRNAPRKSQLKQQSRDARVQELFALAEHLAEDLDHPSYEKWHDKLTALVENYVTQGRDRILNAVLQRCDEANKPFVAEELLSVIESSADSFLLPEEPSCLPRLVSAFLVPVFVPGIGALHSADIRDLDALNELGAKLKALGLVREEAQIAFSPRLYSAQEINSPWSKVLQFTRHIFSPAQTPSPFADDPAQVASEMPASHVGASPSEQPGTPHILGLRYLAGVVVDDINETPFIGPFDEEGYRAWTNNLVTWTNTAGKVLQKALRDSYSGEFLNLGAPDYYYSAFRDGVLEFNMAGLHIEVSRALEDAKIPPTEVHAYVTPIQDEDGGLAIQTSLAVAGTGRHLATLRTEIYHFEDPDEVLRAVIDRLEIMDLDEVFLDENED